jgi:hypothetical protein
MKRMTETTRIDTQEAFSRFLRVVDGFHDSLLHEIVILHPGRVRANGSMVGDGQLPNARLIFQSQSDDIAAVQLDLKRVSTFGFNFTRKLNWRAEFGPSQVRIYQAGHGDSESCEIRAAEVRYKLLGKEARGPHYCMVREELLVDDLFFNET